MAAYQVRWTETAVGLLKKIADRRTQAQLLEAAADARPLLERYSAAKARAIGQDSLAWQDQSAPLSTSSSVLSLSARSE